MAKNNLKEEEEDQEAEVSFKLGKPINLVSLQPQNAGPLFSTCRSVTGVEVEDESNSDSSSINGEVSEGEDYLRATSLGVEPKDDTLRKEDGIMNIAERGLQLFTTTILVAMSCYFAYVALAALFIH